MDLIRKLLVVNPKKRLTAEKILKHPWIVSRGQMKGPNLQRKMVFIILIVFALMIIFDTFVNTVFIMIDKYHF